MLLKLLSQMKNRVLKYSYYIAVVFLQPPTPNHYNVREAGRALGARKELTEGHTNATASQRKHIQPFANRNFRSWNKISSPFITIQVSNSKVHLHNMYYAALFLSQGSSSWMQKPLWLCCHDLFYHPETPVKGSLLFAVWQEMVSIYFTLQHITRVLCCSSVQGTQTELCDSLLSFSFVYFSIGTLAMVLLAALWCFAQWQQEGHQVTWPFLSFPKSCCWPKPWSLPSQLI